MGFKVGLVGQFGVLPDRGGQLFHRRGRLLQVGGLLLGAARQVIVAGRQFLRGIVDAAGRALDLPHDAGQLPGGHRGIVAHLREHTLVVALHPRGQVAGGDRAQHLRQVGDAAL